MRTTLLATALVVLGGCSGNASKDAATQPTTAVTDEAPYYHKMPMKDFMVEVMQHAGDGVWKHQGYIYDAKGERSLFPKNDEEWEDAEHSALLLAEFTNVLLTPPRRVPEAGWDDAVEQVRNVALELAAAAAKRDQATFFEAGNKLDEACDECHKKYDPTFQDHRKPS